MNATTLNFSRSRVARALALVLVNAILGAGLAACHRSPAQGDTALGVGMGTYRAVLTLPGGELPFGFELEAAGAKTIGLVET